MTQASAQRGINGSAKRRSEDAEDKSVKWVPSLLTSCLSMLIDLLLSIPLPRLSPPPDSSPEHLRRHFGHLGPHLDKYPNHANTLMMACHVLHYYSYTLISLSTLLTLLFIIPTHPRTLLPPVETPPSIPDALERLHLDPARPRKVLQQGMAIIARERRG